MRRTFFINLIGLWILLLVGCSQPESIQVIRPGSPLIPETDSIVELDNSIPELPIGNETDLEHEVSSDEIRFLFDKTSNVSYSVREELLGVGFPNDAIGVTRKINGRLVLSNEGKVLPNRTIITVDLASLTSDESRRDNYVRRKTLQTPIYPLAEFNLLSTDGLPSPLPTEGEHSFKLMGKMSIHGVTKSIVWDVSARFSENQIEGSALTQFIFEEFQISIPKVQRVLSVEDLIKLEMSFKLNKIE